MTHSIIFEFIGDADDFAKWVRPASKLDLTKPKTLTNPSSIQVKKSYNVELTLPTSLITEITVEQCLVAGIKA